MNIVKKATDLGYEHYIDLTIEEIDNLPLDDELKQIEYLLIQKWLRNEHRILVFNDYEDSATKTAPYTYKYIDFKCIICPFKKDFVQGEGEFRTDKYDSWERAFEVGLDYAIESIKDTFNKFISEKYIYGNVIRLGDELYSNRLESVGIVKRIAENGVLLHFNENNEFDYEFTYWDEINFDKNDN